MVDQYQASKPEPTIFWEFIDKERNLILKESDIRAGQSVAISVLGVQAQASAAGEKSDMAPPSAEAMTQVAYSYHMNGRDVRRA